MKEITISGYKELLSNQGLLEEYELFDKGNRKISFVSYNSKNIKENSLFICKGNNFKTEYLEDAISMGAVIYVTDNKNIVTNIGHKNIPYFLVSDIRLAISLISEAYFNGKWNKGLNIVGITGTKGKSTVAVMIEAIINEEMKAMKGVNCGFSSGIYTFNGKKKMPANITTPETIELHQLLSECVDNRCEYFVMEVSSQGLKYHRVSGLNYRIGAFLNISEDHISDIEHKDMEDYFNSKLMIFNRCEVAVINKDIPSPFIERILDTADKKCSKVITFGKDKTCDYIIKSVEETPETLNVVMENNGLQENITGNISGKYNAYNIACSYVISKELGISKHSVIKALNKIKIPGRMEHYKLKNNVEVIVDYAHNKLSYEGLFNYTKSQYPNRKIGFLFGCVGEKAFNRRKEAAYVSDLYSDFTVITEIYPGNEPVINICNEVLKNVNDKEKVEIEINRDLAVDKILTWAVDIGDCVVLLCGLGSDLFATKAVKNSTPLSDGMRVEMFKEKMN